MTCELEYHAEPRIGMAQIGIHLCPGARTGLRVSGFESRRQATQLGKAAESSGVASDRPNQMEAPAADKDQRIKTSVAQNPQRCVQHRDLQPKSSFRIQPGRNRGIEVLVLEVDIHDQRIPIPERAFYRSEERRVGKECRSRWSPY